MSERLLGVIGSGTMGSGIAQAAATAGFMVATLDTEPSLVKAAYAKVEERLDRRVAKGKLPQHERDNIVERLHVAETLSHFKDAECVVEAVSEDLDLKRKIFGELEGVVSERTLLASNTSSLSIENIGEGLKRADRFLGMHFFNPAPVMKLVEIVRGPKTGEQAMVDARAVCTKLDKTAVKVKDSPGFIGNRVNRPFYLEALHLLETGEADIRSIDTAMREIGGFRMGPFELLDLIGVDINLRVTETVYHDFGKPDRFKPNAIQEKLVANGRFGRKSGCGFYDHSNNEPTPAYETQLKNSSSWQPTDALKEFAAMLEKPADRAMWIYARIFMAVMNEAALAADTIAIPRDVNLTMELGFNYPEGPLATADHVGLDVMQKLLAGFYEESGQHERYKANPLLDTRVAEENLGEKTSRGFLYHTL
ncbi:MAG: 3-hydroxyacyl-CoA dehydrogenase NAD-binding domain-containing protein [Phycisphaerales bacterium]|nr:3-hydroxyacyl-CoA dehydrogenase NAD-binding domain-containing protein [Phycisphaerales bacterium]